MADGESDVSAISVSDDGAAATTRAPAAATAAKGRLPRGGSRSQRDKADEADSRAVRFSGAAANDVEGDDGGDGDEGYDSGYLDGYDDTEEAGTAAEAVDDASKPLGWSYFRHRDGSEGPVTWDEVDEQELQYVAEGLVATTIKTRGDTQNDDVLQQIFRTQVEQQVSVPDPLGRGHIDPYTLTMVRSP